MPALAKHAVTTPIPVQLAETEFHALILPPLSMPKRGPKCQLGSPRVFNLILWVLYTERPWKGLPVPTDPDGKAEIHSTPVSQVLAKWADDGSLDHAWMGRVGHLSDPHRLALNVLPGDGSHTVAKTGGDGIGDSGHPHQTGEQVIAILDHHGSVGVPLPVAPVHEADTVRLPEGVNALKRVAKLTGLERNKASLNLHGGFDSRHHRQVIFKAGMIPNIKESPRNRKTTKRGHKR